MLAPDACMPQLCRFMDWQRQAVLPLQEMFGQVTHFPHTVCGRHGAGMSLCPPALLPARSSMHALLLHACGSAFPCGQISGLRKAVA